MIYQVGFDLCLEIYDAEVKAGHLVHPEKLQSALVTPFQGFGGEDLYPTLIEKAARLAYGIAEAQAYLDGNKRLAWIVTVVFLNLNDVEIIVDQDEAAHVIRALGTRDDDDQRLLDYEGLVEWFACCAATTRG